MLCLLVIVATACSKGSSRDQPGGRRIEGAPLGPNVPGEPLRSDRVLEVVATTSVAADWLRVVGSTNVRTHVVVKAGLDPVPYLPTPLDVDAVKRADLVVAMGRGLEPWLAGVRQEAAGQAPVLTLTDGLPERPTLSGLPDPYAWLDAANARQMVTALAAALTSIDAVDEPAFSFARDAYLADLDRADQDVRRILVPVAGRGLVTAKESFGWFAGRYGLEVVGAVVPSLNGLSDIPPQHLALLLQAIQARQVRAVFAEASIPEASVQTLALDAGVKAVGGADALLSDGLGQAGTQTDTVLGALRHNARVVADNLD